MFFVGKLWMKKQSLPTVFCIVLLVSGCTSDKTPRELLFEQVVDTNPRPVEGRLSTSSKYVRWQSPAQALPSLQREEVVPSSDGQRIFRGVQPGPEEWEIAKIHRWGLLALYQGQPARAVPKLEAVVEMKPSASVLSDLAAAYLALAKAGQPWLHIHAITVANRAVELDSSAPFAAFNLALALERMSLVHEAGLAWERYLDFEHDKAWRNEAAERLARLRTPTSMDRWKEAEKKLISATEAGDRSEVDRIASQFPRQVRELLERDLLARWGETAGTPAQDVWLMTAKLIATTLSKAGEPLYVEAIAAIESRSGDVQPLVDGHLAYAQGLELRSDCSQAEPVFYRAEESFLAGDSPLALAARFERLVCVYRRLPSAAARPLATLFSSVEAQGYPTLLAKVEVMLGLCSMMEGQHSRAVSHYQRALRFLASVGDTDTTRVLGMLDESYRILGDREGAWQYRLEALESAVVGGDRRILHAILAGVARDMIRAENPEAARRVLGEMLANARSWSEPGAVAETLIRRIELNLSTGVRERVGADIKACAVALTKFQQPADKRRLGAELAIVTAEHKLSSNPVEALQELAPAVAQFEASGHGLLLPRALLVLARAELETGDLAAAEVSFDRALQVYEAHRGTTWGEWHRITFFATAQQAFDAMIRFQALELNDAWVALNYSEQIRARGLRDHRPTRYEVGGLTELEGRLDRIPQGVAVISYTVLPEVLLIWKLWQGSLDMKVLPYGRAQVAKNVDQLQEALVRHGSPEAVEHVARQAFDHLLRPVLEDLPAETELVFVPDRELYRVPFASLLDQRTGRYVIEDHAVVVVPSLHSYLALQERLASTIPELRSVLAVGNPAFDAGRFSHLPDLPYAEREAVSVAALYPESRLLLKEEATASRILSELPGTDVLHLAAHSLFDPGIPLKSVAATAGPGKRVLRATDLDGELLQGLKLAFLSACDTSPGFPGGDREGVAGFARALLAAGVPSVVATLWKVEDEAAGRLAVAFHRHLQEGASTAQALRQAQLVFLQDQSSAPAYSWVPFQLYLGL